MTEGRPSEASVVREVAGRLGWTSALAVAWALLPAALGFLLLANMDWASDWLGRTEPNDEAAYAGFFAVSAGLGLLPTYAQALFGGYRFDVLPGVPLALAGFVGASLIGYALARTVARDRVAREIERWPKAEIVRRAFVGRGLWRTLGTVALVRLPFNSPFALTNLVLAALRVHPVIYVTGTAVGMLPRTAAVVWIGSQLADWGSKERPGWYLPASIGLSLAVLLVLSQIGKMALERASAQGGGGGDSAPASEPAAR